MAKRSPSTRIKVPQSDGEIIISVAGDEPTTYSVSGGYIEVPADAPFTPGATAAQTVLGAVDGAELAGEDVAATTTLEA